MDIQTLSTAEIYAPTSHFFSDEGAGEKNESEWVPLGCCEYAFYKYYYEPTLESEEE